MSDVDEQPRTLLVTLTGKDRPGVTSAMFATLSAAGVEVLDIEQIVLRRRLVLGVLITAPRDWKRLRVAIEETAAALGMQVDVDRGVGDNRVRGSGRSHVTVLGAPLKASAMAAIAGRIADCGANIDRIERMARYPVTAIDLAISGVEPEVLRPLLAAEAASQGIDIAVQPADLLRRSMRLIVMDVDSTLIQGEVIEMIAAHAGCEAEVAAVTEQAMRGEMDFEESLRARVALLEGRPGHGARRGLRVDRPGAGCAHHGAGAAAARLPLRDRLGRLHPDHRTGWPRTSASTTRGPTSSRSSTAGSPAGWSATSSTGPARRPRCGSSPPTSGSRSTRRSPSATAPTTSTCSTRPGLGIAYNAKPVVRDAADTSVNVPYLDTILYLLGISREEIEAADMADGIVTPAPPV